jgi:hypothetical protein
MSLLTVESQVKLTELIQELNLAVRSAQGVLGREVTGGYASDLLSDVLAHGEEGNLWITLQIHQNIVAIASIKDLSGILLVNNRQPEEETIAKAEEEDIPILVSSLSAFEVIGRLYKLGISGTGE